MTASRVTVSHWNRPGLPLRWTYVLHIEGEFPYVSGYRYRSEESARAAGEADLAALRSLTAEDGPSGP